MTKQEKQLQAKRAAINAEVAAVHKQAMTEDGTLDMSLVTGLGAGIDDATGTAKSAKLVEWIRAKEAEAADVTDELAAVSALEAAAKAHAELEATIKRPAMPNGPTKGEPTTIGKLFTGAPEFKSWREREQSWGQAKPITIPIGLAGLQAKALFQTSAGFLPETIRQNIVVDAVTRPIQLLDILPTGPTSMPNIAWMLQTTRTSNAAGVAEGAQKPEDEYVYTPQTSPVEEIATSIPVTETQLEDVPAVESMLEDLLPFGLRQQLDSDCMTGNGVTPNLDGIENVAGIQTQARGADPVLDAYYKALDLVRVTGRANPTHNLIHPTNFQPVRLLKTADGIYIYGSPTEAGPMRMWGLPVVFNESMTANQGLVGSFEGQWIKLWERSGITVEQGWVNDQFRENRRTIRASGRWALTLMRPAAFCTVTGLI